MFNGWHVDGNCGADRQRTIIGVNLTRNHGHRLAVSAGLSIARGEWIFIIDAALQDPPEPLGEMMARMDHDSDVVYGQRTCTKS